MEDEKLKGRREFLKNTALITLGVGIIPSLTKGEVKASSKKKIPDVVCDETTLDLYGQGPFYTANAPILQNNQLSSVNEPGTSLIISGTVYNLDCSQIIPNAEIDIWHADDSGAYDNNAFNLRGKTFSNNQGHYIFETIKPGTYPINTTTFRPSHIHFKITAPGFNTLTTQLYFQGDQYIPSDAAASVTNGTYDASARIIPLVTNAGGTLEGTWDIVVDGSGVTVGVPDIHSDKGVLYKIGPTPFKNELNIEYGVFKNSKVAISVFDIHGKLVAELASKRHVPNKYTVTWKPDSTLDNGHYFIVMKVNDMQIQHHKAILAR